MDTTVKALQNLYVAMGGTLTDTHDDIASGVAVSNYVTIPDMINALAALKSQGGNVATVDSAVVDSDVAG